MRLIAKIYGHCRGRRWVVTAFLLLGLAAVGGGLALPWLVGHALERTLRRLGSANPAVTVGAVGWTRLEVGPLSWGAGAGRTEIAAASITYSPWELLWKRRVRQVMIRDVRLALCRDRLGWQVAGMRRPASVGGGEDAVRAWPRTVGAVVAGLPLDGLTVRGLQYTVEMAEVAAASGSAAAGTTMTGRLAALDWQRGPGSAWWLRMQADSTTVKAVWGDASIVRCRLRMATAPVAAEHGGWRGELFLDGVAARSADPGATWRLADGKLRLPYAWPAAPVAGEAGEAAWRFAAFRSAELTPGHLTVRARPDGLGLMVSGDVRAAAGGPLVALEMAEVHWSPESGVAGRARAVLAPCRVALNDLWLKAWRPAVPGLIFSGTVSGQADLVWQAGRWDGVVAGQLHEGQVRWPARKLEVDGLETGRLELAGLAPPHTRMHQVLRFQEMRSGALTVGPGELVFTLESPARGFLENATLRFAGGRLNAYAVTFDAAKPDLDVLLYADGLQLGALLAQFRPGTGTADARLYGRIPVRREQGQWRLLEGFLYAAPGQRSSLQLHDTAWLAAALGGAGGSAGGETAKRVEAALADLVLRVFTMELVTEADHRVLMRLHVAGKARQDTRLPPVDLTVNVRGDLEPMLNLGLKVGGEGK